jgi:ABC-2 type transport system ATP-binding protein
MNTSYSKILSKSKTSVTLKWAGIIGLLLIPEGAVVIALARIWLDWSQTSYVIAAYIVMAMFIAYWYLWSPAKVPNIIEQDALILTYGRSLRIVVPKSDINSIEQINKDISIQVPFGIEKELKTGILYMVTSKSNGILLTVKQPISVKSKIKNYGYIEKFVFNVDEPLLLKELLEPSADTLQEATTITDIKVSPLKSVVVNEYLNEQEPSLSLEKVGKKYGEVIAVEDISLNFYPGEIFGIIGTNGAGKTTILKMMSGLLKPTTGSIIIKNKNLVAYMPEFLVLYERMNGREFLEFLGVLYGKDVPDTEQKIDELLRLFDMEKASERAIGSYSQGMKRKISFIGTLIKGSSILLLDEPTNGLDPVGIVQVKELLSDLAAAGKTVILSTHILEMAERLCDRVGVIVGGKLLFVGTISELREKAGMKQASLEDIFMKLISK